MKEVDEEDQDHHNHLRIDRHDNIPKVTKDFEDQTAGKGDTITDQQVQQQKQHKQLNQSPPRQQPEINKKILARGVAGLPMSKTPALVGARWGHIECDVDVDDLAYWNDPQGVRDQNFVSPFAVPMDNGEDEKNKKRYLTFEPDPGGWNNVRMSMEVIFVMAAAMGRTLVLPPRAPFYLLGTGKENARSFGSFYDISKPSFQKEVEVITMEEFFERETHGPDGLLGHLTEEEKAKIKPIADICVYAEGSEIHCKYLYKLLESIGYQPKIGGNHNCFVFDNDVFQGQDVSDDLKERVARFCGPERTPVYYEQTIHEPQLIHWDASAADGDGVKGFRLLNHFYSFLFFSDPVVDNVS
jgi:hypothetical protein